MIVDLSTFYLFIHSISTYIVISCFFGSFKICFLIFFNDSLGFPFPVDSLNYPLIPLCIHLFVCVSIWLFAPPCMQDQAPEAVREQVMKLLALLIKPDTGLLPAFEADVGEL